MAMADLAKVTTVATAATGAMAATAAPAADSPVSTPSLRLAAACVILLLTTGLFVGGAQPVAAGLFKPGWDKLVHGAVFAVMGLAYGVASGRQGWRMLVWCVLGALAVGSMDELHQLQLPGREPGWEDLLANGVGGLFGGMALHWIYARVARSEKPASKSRGKRLFRPSGAVV